MKQCFRASAIFFRAVILREVDVINFLEKSKVYVALVAVIISITGCDAGQRMASHLTPLPPPSAAVDPNLVRANTLFGFSLLTQLRNTGPHGRENLLISPFSISVALAMARNGAGGETERAIRTALQLRGLDPQSLNANYVFLQKALQSPDSEVTLLIANSLWGAEDIEFDPAYPTQREAADSLGVDIRTLKKYAAGNETGG